MDFNVQYYIRTFTIFYGSGFMQLWCWVLWFLGPERDGARADKMKLKQKLYRTNTTHQVGLKTLCFIYIYT